jgi:maltooligosyltrehalose trehalohydrolase
MKHTFKVWAPLPKKVELQLKSAVHSLTKGPDDWWTAEVSSVKVGDDYGFIVDGEGPFPDPRSLSQPNGVNGLSRIIDPSAFPWTDKRFKAPPLAQAIVYELHVGTFTRDGTFQSAIEKLEHLVSLGVTHVELMPVVEFGGNHGWGYDGVDLFAPHHAYGSPDDLKHLVNHCHARGLAVLLDVVYNHLGPSGNYLGKFGPYFTKKFATFWGEGINFDGPESDEVRRFFCDNALMWLRNFHFDGLRLDAVHGILDTSATHILEQLKLEVEDLADKIGRPLILIPESDLNDPRLLRPRTQGGYQLDAQWSDDFHHALHTILTGEKTGYYSDFGKIADLAKVLRHAFVYDGIYSPHRRRTHGRSAELLSGHQFLGYLQNHDQIGNRAQGDRISQLVSLGKQKIGAALVLCSPFVPMLFQGEEWGASTPFLFFTDHQEPELARAIREGRCREFAAFGWKAEDVADPQAIESFKRSQLNWSEAAIVPHAEMLQWTRQLIQLRHREPTLADGRREKVHVDFSEAEQWLSMKREAITVVCNLGASPRHLPLHPGTAELLLASEKSVGLDKRIHLPPESVAVLKFTETIEP